MADECWHCENPVGHGTGTTAVEIYLNPDDGIKQLADRMCPTCWDHQVNYLGHSPIRYTELLEKAGVSE